MQKRFKRYKRPTHHQQNSTKELQETPHQSLYALDCFKKVYDMVPHSWIIESLKIFGVADNLISFIQASMSNWSTNLYCNNSLLGNVKIKRGILSFSPILFVIALIPISLVLRKVKMGYKLENNGPTINHMFFMDDLKLFARNENEIDSLSKCSVLTMKRGKKLTQER